MDNLIARPGLHHLAFEIFDHLDFNDLNNLSMISKQFHQFINQREFWIRFVNGLQITQEHNSCSCSQKDLQILLTHYESKTTLKELKNFAKLMEKHCKNRKIEDAIKEAIESENLQFIKLFLNAPPGLKQIYPITMYQLKYYASNESTKFNQFKFILNHADFWDLKPFEIHDEYSLLHYACLHGNTETVKLILNHPEFEEIDDDDNNEMTPLHMAMMNNNFDVVKIMVESPKIDVYWNGYLHTACEIGIEYVKLLLERSDIDINRVEPHGYTPFYSACTDGRIEIVKLLFEREEIDVNLGTDEGFAPIHSVCFTQNIEVIELLLTRQDLDVNNQDKYGDTPLNIACREGYIEIVKLLLQRQDTNVNIQDYDGDTPLHVSCREERIETVKLLLQRQGIDVNLQDATGNTPLHIACNYGKVEIVKLLLQVPEINVNLPNSEGATALHEACIYGHSDIVNLLLQMPFINEYIKDQDQKRQKQPVDYAMINGFADIVQLFDYHRELFFRTLNEMLFSIFFANKDSKKT